MRLYQHTYICRCPCVGGDSPLCCAFTNITINYEPSSMESENMKQIKCWWSNEKPDNCPTFEFDHSIPYVE